MTKTNGEWTDYDDLTERQQMMARLMRPRWPREDFPRFAFFVLPTGELSRRSGWTHRLTEAEQKKIESFEAIEAAAHAKTKGNLRHFRTTTFGLNREP